MLFGPGGNTVSISNGRPDNVRGFWLPLTDGRITVSDRDPMGNELKAIVTVKNATIATQHLKKNGESVYFCEYGKIEKQKGVSTLRFKKGTNRGLDGLSVRHDEVILGFQGTCKTLYKNGRLIWQKFYHGNGKLCYHISPFKPGFAIKYPDGMVAWEFKGKTDTRRIFDGHSVLKYKEKYDDWSRDGICEFTGYSEKGKPYAKGQYENSQRVGVWAIAGKKTYYINGLEVPARLYKTPTEKLDPREIMKMKDADIRSIFLERIGMERVRKAFRTKKIHAESDMELLRLSFPRGVKDRYNLLKVICTTTKQAYYLRVPPNITECEKARQWTFGVEEGDKPIKFDHET